MIIRLLSFIAACAFATGLSAQNAPENKPDISPHAPKALPPAATSARPQKMAPPSMGERIVFLGNGLAERDVYYGRLETELHLRYPAQQLVVRNMGRPGDTPAFRPHPARKSQWAFPGAEKFRPEFAQHNGIGPRNGCLGPPSDQAAIRFWACDDRLATPGIRNCGGALG